MGLRKAIDAALDFLLDLFGADNEKVTQALTVLMPLILQLAEVDEADSKARLYIQSQFDDGLRALDLVGDDL